MTLTIALTSILMALCGALMAATPWLMPATECFSVTVPPSAQRDRRIQSYKRTFSLAVGAVTLMCTLGFFLVLSHTLDSDPTSAEMVNLVSFAMTVATLVPLTVGLGLMLFYRSRVRSLKQAEGWTAHGAQAAAIVDEDAPRPISLAWNLLYVPLTLAMAIFALSSYDRFPSQIPMNADLSGNVAVYVPKSVGAVLFPAIVVGYMGLLFTACHWFMLTSKRPIDPAAPATSALAYGQFARAYSQMTLIGGLLTSAGIGILFYLSALGIVPLGVTALLLMATIMLFVIAMTIVSVRLGQSGARLASELRPNDALVQDDDAHWILGTIYCNRDDPSVMVPKRFGVGWTANIARPESWLVMGAILVLTLAFAALTRRIAG